MCIHNKNEKSCLGQVTKDSLYWRHTAPVWIKDYSAGFWRDTEPNATVTLVKRKGHHYAVTCDHVTKGRTFERNPVRKTDRLTIRPPVDKQRLVLKLLHPSPEEIALDFRQPSSEFPLGPIDIAIARLYNQIWEDLSVSKNKEAIDLDSWQAPSWSDVRYCIVAGYPEQPDNKIVDRHNRRVELELKAVVAEVKSGLGGGKDDRIVLYSRLEDDHGHYFSGMSGGPVYAVEGVGNCCCDEEKIIPVGIACEGDPSTEESVTGKKEGGYFTGRDLFCRALILTPETFDSWLEGVGWGGLENRSVR